MKIFPAKKIIRKFCAVCSASALYLFSGSLQAATVDLLVLYDTYTKDYFQGDVQTAMLGWVNQMNAAYKDSQVDIQLRLVGARYHEESGSNMSEVLSNLRVDAAAIALRDELGADFVSQLHKTGSCGIGYFSVNKNWTWNVLSPNCGPMVMSHELGHNMGLNHSRRQGDTSGVRYGYGLGYGVDNVFASIMAYPSVFKTTRFNRFSNPNISCRGLPCGIPVGNGDEAYAALALQNVRDEIAAFRPTVGAPTSSAASSKISVNSSSRVASSSRSSVVSGSFNLTVEAEKFSSYRGVFTQATTDIGGGENVGWIDPTDWMLFDNITIPTSGVYTVEFRVASLNGGGEMAFDLFDPVTGIKNLAILPVPRTGSYQGWTTISEQVSINAGTYKFGIYARKGGWNVNWWRLSK